MAPMNLIPPQVRAIVWAQWRILWSKLPRAGAGFWITLVFTVLWYAMVAAGAAAIAWFLPQVHSKEGLLRALKTGLFVCTLYWQLIPVVLVSSGLTLDLKRLLVYPIPYRQLFSIEVLLRLTTAMEVIIILMGGVVGLARNPILPWWSPLVLVGFGLFNMFLSVGVRDLLGRWLARKWIREVLVFGFVLLSALPQLVLRKLSPEKFKQFDTVFQPWPWPWTLAARWAAGDGTFLVMAGMIAWIALALWFSYRQFWKNLSFDTAEVRAAEPVTIIAGDSGWREALSGIPRALFGDPLGALIEKEIRSLVRAPRFRLLFFMGFTFGLMIWLPAALDSNRRTGFMVDNFLTFVCVYSTLLLGEVLFWNCFGFDRMAAQAYFVMPVKFSTVLVAKNLVALFFLLLEVGAVCAVTVFLPFSITWMKVAESLGVTVVFGVLLLSVGNLASVRFPKASNPGQSWRNATNAKTGFLMLLIYPLFAIPVSLAYLARYAFGTQAAFAAVLGISFVLSLIVYWVSLDSAAQMAARQKEPLLAALSQGEGLMR